MKHVSITRTAGGNPRVRVVFFLKQTAPDRGYVRRVHNWYVNWGNILDKDTYITATVMLQMT